MNAISKFIRCGMLAALCIVPAASFAAKCSGTNINNLISWEPSEIAKGTTLAVLRATSVTVSDDPSAVYHLISRDMHRAIPHNAGRKDHGRRQLRSPG